MSNPPFPTAFQSRALTGSDPLDSLLAACFGGAGRHRRRLAKVAALERSPTKETS